jgi:hypothetical protein
MTPRHLFPLVESVKRRRRGKVTAARPSLTLPTEGIRASSLHAHPINRHYSTCDRQRASALARNAHRSSGRPRSYRRSVHRRSTRQSSYSDGRSLDGPQPARTALARRCDQVSCAGAAHFGGHRPGAPLGCDPPATVEPRRVARFHQIPYTGVTAREHGDYHLLASTTRPTTDIRTPGCRR